MRDDVPSDRLLRVLHELSLTPSRHSHHGRSSRIRCDLIDNHHRHIELLSHYLSPHFPISTFFQGTQMPSQLLLALCELATTAVVHAEQRGDRIDHLSEEWKQTIPVSDRGSCPPRSWLRQPWSRPFAARVCRLVLGECCLILRRRWGHSDLRFPRRAGVG